MKFIVLSALLAAHGAKNDRSNVVMIIADDLRPEIGGPYKCSGAKTPRLTKLMEESVTFRHAYAQIALCAPSRNSFLSGRAPVVTQSWQFRNDFREVGPEWTSLPQSFKKAGYVSVGAGKVMHPGLPADWDPPSWDERMYSGEWKEWLYPSEPRCPESTTWCAIESNRTNDFEDTQTTERALELLENVTKEEPYFLAVGYRKPHLQWRFPAQYLRPEPKKIATVDVFPFDAPPLAFHMPYSELSNFADVRECGGAGAMNPYKPYPRKCQKSWRRGYYSAVSFVDAEIGKIIDSVPSDALLVVLGDHGWHLGDQAEWEKFTNFENGLRVPLILRHPSLEAKVIDRPVELLDLYPTLTRLAQIDIAYVSNESAPLDGRDLLNNETTYARSMFPRCVGGEQYHANYTQDPTLPDWRLNDCNDVPRELFTHMGYTLRDSDWRFTAWFIWNGTALEPGHGGLDSAIAVALELYDHRGDDGTCPRAFDMFDTVNLASDPSYSAILDRFTAALPMQFRAFSTDDDDDLTGETTTLLLLRSRSDRSSSSSDYFRLR